MMGEKSLKILMMLHSGSLNRGCEAIVRSGYQIINSELENADFYLSSFNVESDKNLNFIKRIDDASPCEVKKYSLDWFIGAIKVKLFSDESFFFRKINQKILKSIDNCDVVLSIGGDAYCYGEQPGYYEIDKYIKEKNKKLVLWGCSIGKEDLSKDKLEDLRKFDLILARESITYSNLIDSGLENVKLCADGAFNLDKTELPLPDGWKVGNTIGINYSPLVYKKNTKSKEAVELLIDYILKNTDMTIALTPHVTEKGNNDYEILQEFYNHYKNTNRVILLPNNLNALEYKGYISRMRFFIGARTHATIAAYSSCVPTMVLGYSVKSRGIAKDIFGDEKLVLGIDDISDFDKLKHNFDTMFNKETQIRSQLEASIPKIIQLSYKAAKDLSELIKK